MESLGFLKAGPQVNQASDLLTLPSCNWMGFQLAVAGIILIVALSAGGLLDVGLALLLALHIIILKSPPHTR